MVDEDAFAWQVEVLEQRLVKEPMGSRWEANGQPTGSLMLINFAVDDVRVFLYISQTHQLVSMLQLRTFCVTSLIA